MIKRSILKLKETVFALYYRQLFYDSQVSILLIYLSRPGNQRLTQGTKVMIPKVMIRGK